MLSGRFIKGECNDQYFIRDKQVNDLPQIILNRSDEASILCNFLNKQEDKIIEKYNELELLKKLYNAPEHGVYIRDGAQLYIQTPNGKKYICYIGADIHHSDVIVGLLNDYMKYKLLVRKHKNDIEQIYGKPLKEQLNQAVKEYLGGE